jgi:glucose/arabinose dehydrogenase
MSRTAVAGRVRRTLPARLALAVLIAVPLVVVPSVPADAAATLTWTRRASGLDQPTQVTSPRDGTGRLFVVEKAGRVRVVRGGTVRSRPYLDISSRVKDDGEGGLLSIAFHPRWKAHPYFWVTYTDNAGDVRLSRFRASTFRSGRAWRSSEKHVLTVPHPSQFTNHFGGQLVFGPGGYLFMSTGDGGGGGDPFNHSQSRKSLQGKLLRLKVVGARQACGALLCTPRTNPYAGPRKGKGLIWAIGLRNAWRFSVDHRTGDLWVGDVGQDAVEEIDRIGRGGLNLGWSCREGNRVYNASRCRSTRHYHPPVWTYTHSYGNSVTGGFIYRGSRFQSLLGGRYIGGDFGSGRIFYSSGTRLVTAGSLPGVTSFGEDQGRELWAVTIGGGLYQMSAS